VTEAVRKVDAVERRLLKAILTVAMNEQEQEIEHFRKGVYLEVNDLRKAEIDELLRSLADAKKHRKRQGTKTTSPAFPFPD